MPVRSVKSGGLLVHAPVGDFAPVRLQPERIALRKPSNVA